jgi:aryl-alcohol dehydrogenase-like predicted oxidoreductase
LIKKTVKKLNAELSVLGYGAWGISGAFGSGKEREYIRTIHAAVDHGVIFFDTAPVYGLGQSEKVLAKALGDRRSQVFLASKCGLVWDSRGNVKNDLSEKSLLEEIPQILQRLGTDHLDLLQVHWPNPDYPLESTFSALNKAREKGWVKHLGVCNFSMADLRQALGYAPIASYQGLYNLLEHNPKSYHGISLEYRVRKEILPYTGTKGLGFFPYSPLMQGLLAGKMTPESRFDPGDVRRANPKLSPPLLSQYLDLAQGAVDIFGGKRSLRELAILWLAGQKGVSSIIAGARNPQQIMGNIEILENPLSDDEWEALDDYLSRKSLIKEG